MLDQLIDRVFGDADEAHKSHLATESYAQHMALGSFYEDVRDKLDSVVEALIGMGIGVPKAEPNPLDMLKKSYGELVAMRSICDGDKSAEALYDELTAVYLSAIYKLERLK